MRSTYVLYSFLQFSIEQFILFIPKISSMLL